MPKYGKGKITFDDGEEIEVEDFQIELTEKMGIDHSYLEDKTVICINSARVHPHDLRMIQLIERLKMNENLIIMVVSMEQRFDKLQNRMCETFKKLNFPTESMKKFSDELKSQNFDLKHGREEKHFEKFNYKTKRGKRKWR